MNNKQIHEKYHNKTKPQNKIISRNSFTYKIILPVLDRYIKSPGKKILDVGCGSGTLSLYLAHKGNHVHGIDISKKAIDSCKKSAKDLSLKNVFFENLDFPRERLGSKKYDAILLLEVIEHLEDDKEVLRLLYSKINPGGILILSTPSINAPLHRLGLTKNFDRKVGHLRRYREKEILDLVKSVGFNIVELRKNEGVLRNFLYTNTYAGKLVRYIKYSVSEIVMIIDKLTQKAFGESDFIIVAIKK